MVISVDLVFSKTACADGSSVNSWMTEIWTNWQTDRDPNPNPDVKGGYRRRNPVIIAISYYPTGGYHNYHPFILWPPVSVTSLSVEPEELLPYHTTICDCRHFNTAWNCWLLTQLQLCLMLMHQSSRIRCQSIINPCGTSELPLPSPSRWLPQTHAKTYQMCLWS